MTRQRPPRAALEAAVWPLEAAAEAMECLARAAELFPQVAVGALGALGESVAPEPALCSVWIEQLGARLGIEAIAVDEQYPRLRHLVASAGPALFLLTAPPGPRLLAVLRSQRGYVEVLDPLGRRRRVSRQELHHALAARLEAELYPELTTLLEDSGVAAARRPRALEQLLAERLSEARVGGCWLLRPAPHARPRQLRRAGLRGSLLRLLLLHAAQYAFAVLSWEAAAHGALLGSVNRAWLGAWVLALLSGALFQVGTYWLAGWLSLEVGGWLRDRLLVGILRRDPATVRREGTGQLLGRVLDAGALEALGLAGALSSLLAVVDFAVAAALLSQGAAAASLLTALGVTLLLIGLASDLYLRRRQAWTDARLQMTHDLVERMLGQRTRIAQEDPQRWHEIEDPLLDRYLEQSLQFDRLGALLPILPRVWMLIAFACLATQIGGARTAPQDLALALGAILIAVRGLTLVSSGLTQFAGALIAWRNVAPLFHTVAREESPLAPRARAHPATLGVLQTRGLTLRHPQRERPLLASVTFSIQAGERVLLEGPSGAGKSTLAGVLAGLRKPDHGLLLFDGLDPATLGAHEWSQRVTLAPQFHENHVLGGTFAFNALLGRRWPPRPRDLQEAESLCRDLGLGPLLDRMPAGLFQLVGETGWQLSHGERSRLFAARAILADANLLVLDESIAALDPHTTELVLDCARKRSRSLLLIAHP